MLFLRIFWLVGGLFLAAGPLTADDFPTRPILRLETGMHTAMINRIAVDRKERWVVTASDDKSARVWDLKSGDLLTILRPPIGEDANEGKLYAVALSPDGGTVAVGGWTGHDWDETASIYLFDRASGQMRRRLTGLPNAIYFLTFSPDGTHLAVALGGGGVRIYRTDTWKEIFSDQEYGNSSYGASFASDGRLVVSNFDGYLRLYDAQFKLVARVKAKGGSMPHGVAFSPDGKKIAVGFADTMAVNLLSGADLAFLFAPETPITQGNKKNLANVAWSSDGQWLYAGGNIFPA